MCEANRHSASVPLDRNNRPAKTRQDMLLDRRFKLIAVCSRDPVWVAGSFNEFRRHWIAWNPELHGLIVDGVGAAQHFGAWISNVSVRPNRIQTSRATSLIVAVQYMRGAVAQDR